MNLLLVLLIIIIILSIVYLYYRNKQYNNILEYFSNNNTQSSLSTYFQTTVDHDSYATNKNMYHGNTLPIKKLKNGKKEKLWDGLWENKSLNIYAQFIQNNDKIIISLSNSSYDIIYNSNTNFNPSNIYENSFVGIGLLSDDSLNFTLIKIITNKFSNPDLNLSVNNFSGNISNNIISLHSSGKGQVIQLTLKNRYSYYNKYAESIIPSINTYPTIPNSEFIKEETPCEDSEPCMDNTNGLSLTTYNNAKYNACGKPKSSSDNTCDGRPSCVFYSPAPDGLQTCSIKTNVYDYMNFFPLGIQTNYQGNTLSMCDYLQYFSIDKCNSCIICYVTNLGNVYTLNYEFFGTLPGESSLTVQSDIMDKLLNGSSNIGILSMYRDAIKNNNNKKDVMDALSFTNCRENNSQMLNMDQIIKESIKTCNKYISNYNGPIGNESLQPCIWQINYKPTKNLLNSCPVILSTSQNYNTQIKYAEFNDNGTTSLSLFSGGIKQQLIFDKVNIIKEKTDSTRTYVAMTANLKTNNGLYLVPSTDYNGFYNSNVVRLVNNPSSNGKWLIIGLTLNNLNDLKNIISNINFNY
jgi:hypothetical protein